MNALSVIIFLFNTQDEGKRNWIIQCRLCGLTCIALDIDGHSNVLVLFAKLAVICKENKSSIAIEVVKILFYGDRDSIWWGITHIFISSIHLHTMIFRLRVRTLSFVNYCFESPNVTVKKLDTDAITVGYSSAMAK